MPHYICDGLMRHNKVVVFYSGNTVPHAIACLIPLAHANFRTMRSKYSLPVRLFQQYCFHMSDLPIPPHNRIASMYGSPRTMINMMSIGKTTINIIRAVPASIIAMLALHDCGFRLGYGGEWHTFYRGIRGRYHFGIQLACRHIVCIQWENNRISDRLAVDVTGVVPDNGARISTGSAHPLEKRR